MAQYIDKSALVAEIEKRIKTLDEISSRRPISLPTLEKLIEENKKVLSYLDTLEVKEANLEDLKEELDRVIKIYKPYCNFGWGTLYNIATYFFELGLKVQK